MRPLLLAGLTLALLTPPAVAPADGPPLEDKRAFSCAGRAFDESKDGYVHKAFGVAGPLHVGGAELEWCQTAQNAVIYFYTERLSTEEQARCAETMSFAVFPGIGNETRDIIDGNADAFNNPQVKIVSPPVTGPTRITAGGRTIDAYQYEAVVDQNGAHLRKRMIGYAHGKDFIRVATGYVDKESCGGVVKGFLAALKWP